MLGDGYDSVDLGTLNWYGPASNDRFYSNGIVTESEPSTITQTGLIFAMDMFTATSDYEVSTSSDNNLIAIGGDSYIYARKTDCSTGEEFKAAVDGVILFYKKKTT